MKRAIVPKFDLARDRRKTCPTSASAAVWQGFTLLSLEPRIVARDTLDVSFLSEREGSIAYRKVIGKNNQLAAPRIFCCAIANDFAFVLGFECMENFPASVFGLFI